MVIVPHVKPDAEEAGVVSRRPYPWMARPGRRETWPRQWHVTRGGVTVVEELQRGD